MTRSIYIALLVTAATAVSAGCSFRVAGGAPTVDASAADLYLAAVTYTREHHGWPLRIDPRIMDSIPTQFNYERDVHIAPTPSLAAETGEERRREMVLGRLNVPRERIENYIACTPHIGGVPVKRPWATPEWQAAADSARSACAERESYGIAIFGIPRRAEGRQSWKIRYYYLNAVTRQVVDLELAPSGRAWTVIAREELLSVSS
jgi:hypothetical protein